MNSADFSKIMYKENHEKFVYLNGKLIEALRSNDPLELLAQTSFATHFGTSDEYNSFAELPLLNFLFNLSLKVGRHTQQLSNGFSYQKFFDELEDCYRSFFATIGGNPNLEKFTPELREIIHQVQSQYLIEQVNPQIYDFQLLRQTEQLFSPQESDFLELLKFTPAQALAITNTIPRVVEERFNNRKENCQGYKKELEMLIRNEDFLNSVGLGLPGDLKAEDIPAYLASMELFSDLKNEFLFTPRQVAERVGIDVAVVKHFLESISISFSEESQKYDVPTDEDISLVRPSIRVEDGLFFIPCLRSLKYRHRDFFEAQLEQHRIGNTRVWHKYKDRRHDYALEIVGNSLKKIFRNVKVYVNLHYQHDGKDGETDVLVQYDDKILLCEIKAGGWSDGSKAGKLIKIEKDLKGLVAEAFDQATKASEYILNTKAAHFTDESKRKTVFQIQKVPNEIFCICITLEHLMALAANLNNAKGLNLFKTDRLPLCVNLLEFELLCDYLGSPSIFFHYLKQRLRAQAESIYHAYDEISFLSLYLKNGSFFTWEEGKKPSFILISPTWIQEFDDYYNFGGQAPKLALPKEVRAIVDEFESLNNYGHSSILSGLLNLGQNQITGLMKKIKILNQQTEADKAHHSFSFFSKEPDDCGITFISKYGHQQELEDIEAHCYLKKYQMKASAWIGLLKDVTDKRWTINQMVLLNFPWTQDTKMDEAVKTFQDNNFERKTKSIKKIGRNDLCPCGSTLKYEKCHGKS